MATSGGRLVGVALTFAGVTGLCGIAMLGWMGSLNREPWDITWLVILWAPLILAPLIGAVCWKLIARSKGRPSPARGALAAGIAVIVGYAVHAAGLFVFVVFRESKDAVVQSIFALIFLYSASMIFFVPAALLTGAGLGWASRRAGK